MWTHRLLWPKRSNLQRQKSDLCWESDAACEAAAAQGGVGRSGKGGSLRNFLQIPRAGVCCLSWTCTLGIRSHVVVKLAGNWKCKSLILPSLWAEPRTTCNLRYYSLARLFISPYIFISKQRRHWILNIHRDSSDDGGSSPLDDDHLH